MVSKLYVYILVEQWWEYLINPSLCGDLILSFESSTEADLCRHLLPVTSNLQQPLPRDSLPNLSSYFSGAHHNVLSLLLEIFKCHAFILEGLPILDNPTLVSYTVLSSSVHTIHPYQLLDWIFPSNS